MFPSFLKRVSINLVQRGSIRGYSNVGGSSCRVAPVSSFDFSQLKHALEISVPPLARRPNPIKIPGPMLELPIVRINKILEDPQSKVEVRDPNEVIEQQAARLIVIRRKKMKRHKLKKLRKRMRFAWAKVRQKRELKKEKEFHVEIMTKLRTAEKFDAAAYVNEKIEKANEVLLPKLWKGKRLPQFVIEDLLEKEKIKKEQNLKRIERRKQISLNVSDYKV